MAAALHRDMSKLMQAAGRAAALAAAPNAPGTEADFMEPAPGCHPLFSAGDFASRMKVPEDWKEGDPYPMYKGTAHTIFSLMMEDAIPGAPVSMHDVRSYREAHFSKLKAAELVKWESPVTVVVAEGDASSYDSKAPAFRKISMDVMVFAFLEEFRHRLRDEALEAGCIPVGFLQAARHVPVNYVLVPAGSAREEHIYVLSLQIMGDFRIAEEAHAPCAWQLCQLWAQARGMKQKAGSATEDAPGAVAEILKRVRCGKTCE